MTTAPEIAGPGSASCRFGPFELRPTQRTLLRDGAPQKLGGRAFDLLVTLVQRRERVVSKSELLDLVWPRLVVEENNLQVHVLTLRKLLGPSAIATVPGRGYRFVAPLASVGEEHPPQPTSSAPPEATTRPDLPALLGREEDLDSLVATMRTRRLVTLLGAGGVGKSTLARHASAALAGRFEDGAIWVDLTTLHDGAAVVEALASATRSVLPRGDRVQALAAALRPMHALVVLDNCEHVLEGVTRVAQALHDAAPRLHLLLTSQAPLRLRAEQLHRLDPLALADPDAVLEGALTSPAVQLFVQRVRASDRHFVLDEANLRAVVSLTRRLDGLPLAIELAAARVPALSAAQLDDALGERFRLLTAGDPLAPPRQHSLRAAMLWTHGLLEPADQAVFRRLAVFVGGFDLPAAQRVCSDEGAAGDTAAGRPVIDEWQVLDALSVLVDRSLVTPPVGEPPRYRLLDTPLAFARQLLEASGELATTRERHLAHFRAWYEAAYEDHLWRRQSVPQWLARFGADADNGLAALARALVNDAEAAVALTPGLAQALARRHADRFKAWHDTVPLLTASLPPDVRARWQLGFAQFWGINGGDDRFRLYAQGAAAHFRTAGHAAGEYRAQAIIATLPTAGSEYGAEAALARLGELEQPHWPADLRFLRPWAHASQLVVAGRYEEAIEVGHSCLALIRESGREGRLIHEMGMMYAEILAGRLGDAITRGEAAVRRMRERQRHAPASGPELLLLAAWLLEGDAASARRIGPAVWDAGRAFSQKGPCADTLSLLAALEDRPRSAMLLVGYARIQYKLGARLALYRRCAEQAEAIAARTLAAAEIAALHGHGGSLADEAVGALAFGSGDAAPQAPGP